MKQMAQGNSGMKFDAGNMSKTKQAIDKPYANGLDKVTKDTYKK